MLCPKCGKEIRETAKFCSHCGISIIAQQSDGSAHQINTGQAEKTISVHSFAKRHRRGSGARGLMIAVLILLLLCILSVVGLYIINGFEDMTETIGDEDNSMLDAESYFERTSTVISAIPVGTSEAIQSEREVYKTILERGFEQYPISTTYSVDGEYYDTIEITEDSTEVHPLYETYYQSENGEYWTIYSVNGATMAFPISYNMESDLGVEVMLSETESVMSYDYHTNTFYENIPNDSTMIVVVVDRIDSETLDKMTIEEIDHHVK